MLYFDIYKKSVDEFLNKANIYVTPKKSEIKYVGTYIHSERTVKFSWKNILYFDIYKKKSR